MNEDKDYEAEVMKDYTGKDVADAKQNGLISFILGIVGIVFGLGILGIILGVYAIKMGKQAKSVLEPTNPRYQLASIGIITGWISIILSIFILLIYIYAIVIVYSGIFEDINSNW